MKNKSLMYTQLTSDQRQWRLLVANGCDGYLLGPIVRPLDWQFRQTFVMYIIKHIYNVITLHVEVFYSGFMAWHVSLHMCICYKYYDQLISILCDFILFYFLFLNFFFFKQSEYKIMVK